MAHNQLRMLIRSECPLIPESGRSALSGLVKLGGPESHPKFPKYAFSLKPNSFDGFLPW